MEESMEEATSTAFIAGATGYVGQALVEALAARRVVIPVAHVRPGSSSAEALVPIFQAQGARIERTPWQPDAMAQTLERLRPDVVFCVLGTTRDRMKRSDDDASYEAVDYGLTKLLVDACRGARIRPRFVYVSAIGVKPGRGNAYMRARWKADAYVRESGLPHTVARPAIISGPDRDEARPGERFAATAVDAALSLLGAVGLDETRDRWASMDAGELAAALIALAYSPDGEGIFDPKALRAAAASA